MKWERQNNILIKEVFKMKKLFFILPLLLVSCKKEIYKKEGQINIISNVYFNASKGLSDYKSFVVSRISYRNDTLVEFVPSLINDMDYQTNVILDSIYYTLPAGSENKVPIDELIKNSKGRSVYKKNSGALFTKERIVNYDWKKDIKDTTLFNVKYKRFDVDSPISFSRYYVKKSDTLLPYSLYENERKAKRIDGQIWRIDSYNKKKDIFITLQLIPTDKIDFQAKSIFDYNKFFKKSTNE